MGSGEVVGDEQLSTSNQPTKARDITKYVLQYRECSRHVWNTYFMDIDGGHSFFREVDIKLFDGLVLSEFDFDIPYPSPNGYVEQIEVRYELPPLGLPIMYVFRTESRKVQWAERKLNKADNRLCFIEFFDFADFDQPRDLRYTRVRAIEVGEAPELNGADFLIDTSKVRFVC